MSRVCNSCHICAVFKRKPVEQCTLSPLDHHTDYRNSKTLSWKLTIEAERLNLVVLLPVLCVANVI